MIHYIKELLKTHDCVIIPGLGGLIGHYEPARRNMAAGTMAPPMKRIAFNRALRQNDGLLINYIARKKEVSYAEATKLVETFRDEVDHALQLNGSFLFAGVGKLSFDASKKLQFYPILKENLLLDTYSLPLVVAQPIQRIKESFVAQGDKVEQTDPIEAQIELHGADKRDAEIPPVYQPWIFRAAAVIGMAFLMTTAGMSYFGGNVSGDQLSILPSTRVNPETSTIASESGSRINTDLNFHLYEETELAAVEEIIKDEPVEIIAEVRDEIKNTFSEATIDHIDKYHVIVGSFLDKTRLNREMETMRSKGFEVETLPGPNGYTRLGLVFDGAKVSRQVMLKQVRSTVNADAWMINS